MRPTALLPLAFALSPLCVPAAAEDARPASVAPPAAVGRLVRDLGHAEWKTREAATQALRGIGAPAVDALREAAKSEDEEVRSRAAALLDRIARDLMGHTLIADTYGGRVVEVDADGAAVWTIEGLDHPSVAQRLADGRTLVAEREGGRVTIFDRAGTPVWRMEGLGRVWHAAALGNGHVLMTCCGDELFAKGKVVEVDAEKREVWKAENLDAPRSCQRLADGRTLIVERAANRLIEVDAAGTTVWTQEGLNAPLDAVRLPDGHTLVGEWQPARVVELDRSGKAVWEFTEGLAGAGHAVRLENGDTLLTDFPNNRVLEVTPAKQVVWEFGGLEHPCSAVRVPAGR